MEHCKLQIGCLIVLFYIIFNYYRTKKVARSDKKIQLFDVILFIGIVELIFDGLTAYTVNHLDTVPGWLNDMAHLVFLISIDATIFAVFLYMLVITEGFPETRIKRGLLFSPFVLNVLIVIFSMDYLEYRIGRVTNYSMGIPAYTCFVMATVYILFTLFLFVKRWRYIENNKRASIGLYLFVLMGTTIFQMLIPEALITGIVTTIVILGIYLNQENPLINELSTYQHEMVMGFATLVENKDDSTGGHIKRTSLYVELLAKELRDRGYYEEILTKDYINHLRLAAPMHDIGKIGIPDAILQKPGKLTEEEYAVMKLHTTKGGKIIKETFSHIEDEVYREMVYRVAMYHHERWNGKGYPEGLKEKEIPLCARIMAIADVFDAISEKRCYRDAMPMEQCFEIIRAGSGTDFEPQLVEVFLDSREEIQRLYDSVNV